MEQQIKQRLVGAVVLIALAVIFLPMVLHGPRIDEPGAIPARIPPEPVPANPPALDLASSPPTVLPVEGIPRTAVAAPRTQDTGRSTPIPQAAAPNAEAPPVISPNAWSVQVGGFGSRDNAYALRDKLRKNRFAAYVMEPAAGQSNLYRVRVGPELDRANARKVMEQLQREMKLKGVLVKHQ